ncbi:MAG: murein biosynthesis integral membrane protein MurJ [Patescibacteria group bacterium]|nr:murein biosynthesis integral membrane protein MurJ [Patescibacteria group bacterium]
MLKKILNRQTKNLTAAAFIFASASLISAALGLFRDRLLAKNFGAGDELDIYYAAFRIPDFISFVLIMGAIGAAIVPIFSSFLVRSREEGFNFVSNILNLFLISLIIISIFLFIFAPQLISLVAPGFEGTKKALTVTLTRIMLLSPILLGVSNVISGVLRVFRRFLITSLSPIMYNLGIITGIFFFAPKIGVQGVAWGVVLGGALHLLIQLPTLFKVGFKPKKILNIRQSGILEAIKLTIPRSIGLAASQINLIVITAIASGLTAGSISVFYLAETFSRPLLTLVAISFSTAAFPTLALAFSKKNQEKFIKVFYSIFYKIIFLIVPLSILLFFFREWVVKIVLRVGKFGLVDARLTAACLGGFLLGIFAQGLVLLIAQGFYALHNTKIPALASLTGMVINISLSLIFVKLLSFPNFFQQFLINFLKIETLKNIQIIGLPLALSISAIIQFVILYLFFQRKIRTI